MPEPVHVQIMQAGPNNLGAVVSLFDGYRRFYGRPSDIPAATAFIKQRLSREDSVIFLARVGPVPAGFTQLYPTFTSVDMGRVWHLNDLFVDERFRRHGIGRALMKHALEFAHADGAVRLTLETAKDNLPAQSLYNALGMVQSQKFVKYALQWFDD